MPGEKLAANAAVAGPDERARLWAALLAKAPFFAAYQRRIERQFPMVEFSPR